LRVGFVTRYHRAECAFAALTVAEHLLDIGHAPRLFSTTPAGVSVHAYWDQHVTHEKRIGDFQRWCQQNDVVVWTHLPDEAMLHWVSAKSVANIYLLDWTNIAGDDLDELRAMDHVVSPHVKGVELLSSVYKLAPAAPPQALIADPAASKLVYCPWSPSAAILEREKPASRRGDCRVLVVCDGFPTSEVFDRTCAMLQQALSACSTLDLTVMADLAKPPIRKGLRPLLAAGRATGRARAIEYPRYDEFPSIIAKHDLLFYPACLASYSYPVLWAASRGVPIVCYHNPPYGPVVRESRMGTALDCGRNIMEGGAVCVRDYDPEPLVQTVTQLANNPTALSQLENGDLEYLRTQRKGFELVWSGLLRDLT
jgi:hypothetical protein